jgi:hypothetical protein
LRSGEMSRFLLQMKYDNTLRPDFLDINFKIKTNLIAGESIKRTEEHTKQLLSLFHDKNNERPLSPSAINTWLNCRMKFFYRYINRLKERESISTDIDSAMLGNILHEMMKNIYKPYIGDIISKEALKAMIRDQKFLSESVNKAVNEKFKAGRDDLVSGNELIVRDVLKEYLLRILNTDAGLAPFLILNLEAPFNFVLPFQMNSAPVNVLTGGNIDRVDNINGVIRIVDYKTGTVSESINSVNDLFIDDRKKDADAWLQTLVYCEAYLATLQGSFVRPSVYKIKKLNDSLVTDRLKIKTGSRGVEPIENYLEIREEFLSGLTKVISIIFNEDEPFIKTTDIRGKCTYCPYKILCMR